MLRKTIIVVCCLIVIGIAIIYFFGDVVFFTSSRKPAKLTIIYPFNETIFPPEISPPAFQWNDENSGAGLWKIRFDFDDKKAPVEVISESTEWSPDKELWTTIKKRSFEKRAKILISGLKKARSKKILSANSIWFSTSGDEVGAPIFYRDVPLPFIYAVNHKEEIKWRLGDISSDEPPRVVLENLPVCGNCHSFTADGGTIGMDIDYANDKGSYVIAEVQEEIVLSRDKVITWSDYNRDERDPTFGLLSQISPDARYAVSTVKDRSVFVPKEDLYYSQLFFPLKGILAVYYRDTGEFRELPGADDREYVQSNPSWSPDSKYIVFARSKAAELKSLKNVQEVLLSPEECQEYINREKLFLFDLYRLPFNGGKGGKPEPVQGASDNGMSNYFAKFSPDGKWMVFNKASSFMLLQPDSELYIMPAGGGEPRRMRCNTDQMNSWHSWSPNSRWLVFASKVFTPYTQLFLTHIDENGNDSPPVLLSNFTAPDRAANIPEFVNISPDGIKRIHQQYVDEYSYYREGGSFLDHGEYELAEEAFQEAIKLNPENSDSHTKMGSLYIKTGKYDRAIEALETALKLDRNNVQARNDLAGILVVGGNYDRAQKELQEVLKLDPDNSGAYTNLGLMFLRKNDYDNAEREFQKALRIDPENAYAHRNIGMVLMKKKDYDRAEHHLKEALRLDHLSSLGHYNLGRVYLTKKDYASAEKEFRHALDIEPGNPTICFTLGEILSRNTESHREAIELFKRGLAVNPEHFRGHIMLGNLYINTGNINSAIGEFEKALSLNPQAPNLREKIHELKRLADGN